MTVEKVRESHWEKDGQPVTTYYVTVDGKETPCYDAKAKDLVVGQALPEGWEVKTSKAGKPYLSPPRAPRGFGGGGGAAAYRNTAEGQAAEQRSIHASVALEWSVRAEALRAEPDPGGVLITAESFFAWLQTKAAAPPTLPAEGASKGSSGSAGGVPGTPPATSSASGDTQERKPAGESHPAAMSERPGAGTSSGSGAEGEAAPGPGHIHEFKPHPRLKKLDMCVCGETRRKVEA